LTQFGPNDLFVTTRIQIILKENSRKKFHNSNFFIIQKQKDKSIKMFRYFYIFLLIIIFLLLFFIALGLQEQIQLNYITSREQLKKPKAVNKLGEKDEERVVEIWHKVVRRADRHILTTLNAIFDKVSGARECVTFLNFRKERK
jgi:hypothetical protein